MTSARNDDPEVKAIRRAAGVRVGTNGANVAFSIAANAS
jgi:hypothetical protein